MYTHTQTHKNQTHKRIKTRTHHRKGVLGEAVVELLGEKVAAQEGADQGERRQEVDLEPVLIVCGVGLRVGWGCG